LFVVVAASDSDERISPAAAAPAAASDNPSHCASQVRTAAIHILVTENLNQTNIQSFNQLFQ